MEIAKNLDLRGINSKTDFLHVNFQKYTTKTCFQVCRMSKSRLNCAREETPHSFSLVWFLSMLFPVGRSIHCTGRSTTMNHLYVGLSFSFFFFPFTTHCSADVFLQEKIKCAQQREEQKFHKCYENKEPVVARWKVRGFKRKVRKRRGRRWTTLRRTWNYLTPPTSRK